MPRVCVRRGPGSMERGGGYIPGYGGAGAGGYTNNGAGGYRDPGPRLDRYETNKSFSLVICIF